VSPEIEALLRGLTTTLVRFFFPMPYGRFLRIVR